MNTLTVQFTRSWRNYRKGQVIDPPAGQAREMIRRGIVVAVETAPVAGAVTMTPPLAVGIEASDGGPRGGKKRKATA